MSLLNRAYSRGVAELLLNTERIKVASLEKLAAVADMVGDRILFDPTQPVHPQHTLEVAEAIIKTAEETGTLITGDKPEQKNTPENASSQVGGLAALDDKQRPQGTYNEGAGQTSFNTAGAMVGKEEKHPEAPANTDPAPNSVNKEAQIALQNLINKIAGTGSLVTGEREDQQNTPENAAAQVGGLAAMDLAQRPQGSYLVGVGNTDLKVPKSSVVGAEQPHPNAPGNSPPVHNSLTEASKSAAYKALFDMTARQVLPHLPTRLADTEKVAAVRTMMGMTDDEKVGYLSFLVKKAEESPLPAFMMGGMKEEKKDEKKEDKKEEKKDEECKTDEKKKEAAVGQTVASLLEDISKIARLASR